MPVAALCLIIAGATVIGPSCVAAQFDQQDASSEAALLTEAIESYNEAIESDSRERRVERFTRAELIFQSLVDRQSDGSGALPSLYTNLGNSALGAEHLGEAIAAYREALLLDPANGTARQNLNYARTLLPDWVPKPEEEIDFGSFFDSIRRMNPSQWYAVAAILFLASSLALAGYQRTGKTILRNVALLGGVAWLACFAAPIYRTWNPASREGVVVRSDAIVRSADSANSPVRFSQPLPSGTEFMVQQQRQEWLRIRLFDGRTGWLPTSAVRLISGTSD